jgi:FtsP/CotA-like multicopper oxidase with cupredoxin domain
MNRLFAVLLPISLIATEGPKPGVLEPVAPNDFSRVAGNFDRGILTIALEARLGAWRPDGDNSSSAIEVAAFAEEGRALSAPGPLIRIPEGTEVRATIRNRLSKPIVVYGFGGPKGKQDSLVIQPNAMRSVRFNANKRGTMTYAARRLLDRPNSKPFEDTQLYGVMVVYPPMGIPTDEDRFSLNTAITAWTNEK